MLGLVGTRSAKLSSRNLRSESASGPCPANQAKSDHGGSDADAHVCEPPQLADPSRRIDRRTIHGAAYGRAQEAWPTRSVRYVNGFPAGGATNSLSRILCQKMSELSGQSFVVENRAGAGGALGADAVAKSPPDGYTVGLGGIASNVLAIGSYAELPTTRSAISRSSPACGSCRISWSARRSLFSSDHEGVAGCLQEGAVQIHLRVAGFGTTLHLSGEMMNSMAGVEVVHIPYEGAGPALNDLLGGRVDMLFDNLPGSLPSVRAGLIKPIAVTSRTRIPDVPRRAGHGRGAARICGDLMDGHDRVGEHAGRSGGADQRAHHQGARRPPGEDAIRRPRRIDLADVACRNCGIPRQRAGAAAAGHAGGRDQAGSKVGRAEGTTPSGGLR